MEAYSLSSLTKKLLESNIFLISTKTLKDLLEVENERTFYRIVNDFVKNKVLINIEKNKYLVVGKGENSLKIANFLYQPSYISCETALNYWGVLSQFPFEITSITSKKGITKKYDDKVFSYNHIATKYFGMYTKKDGILIALPEKALFDQLYLSSKGLKVANIDEYDLSRINKKTFIEICKKFKIGKKIYADI